MGRPSKLLRLPEAMLVELCQRVEQCGFLSPAAVSMGIPDATALQWMSKGAEDTANGKDTLYARFAARITRARGQAEFYLAGELIRNDDWRARARALESIAPERWMRREAVDLSGSATFVLPAIVEVHYPEGSRPKALPAGDVIEGELVKKKAKGGPSGRKRAGAAA